MTLFLMCLDDFLQSMGAFGVQCVFEWLCMLSEYEFAPLAWTTVLQWPNPSDTEGVSSTDTNSPAGKIEIYSLSVSLIIVLCTLLPLLSLSLSKGCVSVGLYVCIYFLSYGILRASSHIMWVFVKDERFRGLLSVSCKHSCFDKILSVTNQINSMFAPGHENDSWVMDLCCLVFVWALDHHDGKGLVSVWTIVKSQSSLDQSYSFYSLFSSLSLSVFLLTPSPSPSFC